MKDSEKLIFEDVKIQVPSSSYPRVVIIGGGFGGITIAKKLLKYKLQVVMLDRNNYHTFQPLLYQVATAGLEPDSIAGPLRKLMESKKNFYFRMARVTRINPDRNSVSTLIGELTFDYLIIANGAKTNFFEKKNIANYAFPLKQIPHALDLRSHILQNFEKAVLMGDEEELKSLLTIVIVGGGPTGVEVAGALSELKRHVLPRDYHELDFKKMDIYLIEGLDRLLMGMSEKSGQNALKYLEQFGVKVYLNTLVEDYKNGEILLANGKVIKSKTLIWAAGVEGNLIKGISDEKIGKGRYLVDEYHRVAGYDNIFAVGDIAIMSKEDNPDGHPMLAPIAMQQGDNLVRNLLVQAGIKKKPLRSFHYKNKGVMATIGRNKAVVDLPGGIHIGGRLAWFIWMFVHLISIIGFRNKIVIISNWVWNYFTYDRGTRLIIRLFLPGNISDKKSH
jgi:NADH dehydrogenase